MGELSLVSQCCTLYAQLLPEMHCFKYTVIVLPVLHSPPEKLHLNTIQADECFGGFLLACLKLSLSMS